MAKRRRVKQGDTKRRRWQLFQRGAVIDLTTATAVEMRAVLAPGESATGTTTLTGAMGFSDRPNGIVLEPVGGTGALAEALYRVGFWITWGDGTLEKVPDENTQELEVVPGP